MTATAMNVPLILIEVRDGFSVLLHNLSSEWSSFSYSRNSDRRTESNFFDIFPTIFFFLHWLHNFWHKLCPDTKFYVSYLSRLNLNLRQIPMALLLRSHLIKKCRTFLNLH